MKFKAKSKSRAKHFHPSLCFYLFKSLDFSLVLLHSLLPHHDLLLVLLQLILLVVHLDTQTGLLGLKLKTETKGKLSYATKKTETGSNNI